MTRAPASLQCLGARAPDAAACARNKSCPVCHVRHVIFHNSGTMAYDDLREFIRALEKHGELKRIPFEVDPHLEITEFADRSVKSGGPALLFEKPKGSDVPVLINAFASMRRMEIALEVSSVEEIAGRISEFLEMRMPEGLLGKLKMLPKLADMASFFPKIGFERALQGRHPPRRNFST